LYFDKKKQNAFHGRFNNGMKEGKGSFIFADGSTLSGIFKEDCLEGKGEYLYEDGSLMVGTYAKGELTGPSEEFDCDGERTFSGQYANNIRVDVCQFFIKHGGRLFGIVDKEGKLSGKDVVYAYPDEKTFLKGRFKDGEMVCACEAKYNGIGDRNNPYSYNKTKKGVTYSKDESTYTTISSNPLLSDIYENYRVEVKASEVEDAGEGLFSLIGAEEGEVMSFYNGVRVPHAEVDARDWKFNDNTISLDDQIVIDVPQQWSSTETYTASLGHKANHSFEPNCKYDKFDHPRFGRIKCIRTIQPVEAGDELTVAYGYDHNKLDTDAPDWYKHKLKEWTKNNREEDKHRTFGS